MKRSLITFYLLCVFSASTLGQGNETITSFNKAKKKLHHEIYFDHRETIYCGAAYEMDKSVTHPEGFNTTAHVKRSKRIEWEHIVPAENFGRTFVEWREGHAECVDSKGKSFKGRKCASKMNMEYRLMQADMYNLYPAIGAVNALRSNYNFTMMTNKASDFGSCRMKIEGRKAQPPERARGRIARTYMYMEQTYPRYKMSKQTKRLMEIWNELYPVSVWECQRARRIEQVQGNRNEVLGVCYQ